MEITPALTVMVLGLTLNIAVTIISVAIWGGRLSQRVEDLKERVLEYENAHVQRINRLEGLLLRPAGGSSDAPPEGLEEESEEGRDDHGCC